MVKTQLILKSYLDSDREQPATKLSYFSPSLEEWHRRLRSANSISGTTPLLLTEGEAEMATESLVAA